MKATRERNKNGVKLDEILKELIAVKKLFIFYLSKSGASSNEIGKVLGVGGSAVRNILAEKRKK